MPAPSANDSKRPSASAALDLTPYTDKDQEIARDAETPVKYNQKLLLTNLSRMK